MSSSYIEWDLFPVSCLFVFLSVFIFSLFYGQFVLVLMTESNFFWIKSPFSIVYVEPYKKTVLRMFKDPDLN